MLRTHHIKGGDSAGHEEASTERSAELSGETGRDGLTLHYGSLVVRGEGRIEVRGEERRGEERRGEEKEMRGVL